MIQPCVIQKMEKAKTKQIKNKQTNKNIKQKNILFLIGTYMLYLVDVIFKRQSTFLWIPAVLLLCRLDLLFVSNRLQ